MEAFHPPAVPLPFFLIYNYWTNLKVHVEYEHSADITLFQYLALGRRPA